MIINSLKRELPPLPESPEVSPRTKRKNIKSTKIKTGRRTKSIRNTNIVIKIGVRTRTRRRKKIKAVSTMRRFYNFLSLQTFWHQYKLTLHTKSLLLACEPSAYSRVRKFTFTALVYKHNIDWRLNCYYYFFSINTSLNFCSRF